MLLAEDLSKNIKNHGEAFNFGPPAHQNHSVSELIVEMSKYWDQVRWNDISNNQEVLHEAGLLKLNCDKALFALQWEPVLSFQETVKMTVDWYKEYYQSSDNSPFPNSVIQVEKYIELASKRNLSWASND